MSNPRSVAINQILVSRLLTSTLVCGLLVLVSVSAKATTYGCYIGSPPHTLRSPGDVRIVSSPSDCIAGETAISWDVFSVGTSPGSVGFDGTNIWVSNYGSNSITELRASDGANLGTFPAGITPGKSVFDGQNIWITNWTANTLTKVQASDGTLLATIPVRNAPAGLAFDGTNIWVSFYGNNSVSKLRLSDGAELSNTPGVNSPLDILFDGTNIWAANNTGGGAVTKIDAGNGAILGVFNTTGGFPGPIAFDGNNVWVANSGTQSLSKNRVSDGVFVGAFAMGFGGAGVAFDGLNIWAANDDVVLRYRASDGALLGSFPGSYNGSGRYETAVTFDGTYVWVANYMANTVTRYHDLGRDTTAPVTTATLSQAPNAAGWNNSNVSVLLSATDESGGSGVASITYSATGAQAIGQTTLSGDGANLNITAEGQTTISYFSRDNAGNTEQAKTLVVKIDKTAPVISITTPTAGNYLLNQVITVQYSCNDGGSAVASCSGTSANGGPLDTAGVGAKTFTVNATDNAGNNAVPVVVNYSVGYNVVALYDQTKAAKSGSTIPIKIRLVDANGSNFSSPATVVHAMSIVQISSQSSTAVDDSGNANPDLDFRYDTSLGGYIFNLKTTGYATGSYVLNFGAGDGPTVYSVGFQVRR